MQIRNNRNQQRDAADRVERREVDVEVAHQQPLQIDGSLVESKVRDVPPTSGEERQRADQAED